MWLKSITVASITGNARVMNVEPTTTMRDIKNRLYELEGISANQQRLLYRGRILRDEDTIESLGIADGQVIHMVLMPNAA